LPPPAANVENDVGELPDQLRIIGIDGAPTPS
jgi:hypothetical protein